jgi:hypothetical protein
MVNKKFWLGMLVMALVFGMMVVGCDDGSTDGDGSSTSGSGGGGKGIGAKLELSGKVYTMIRNNKEFTVSFPEYTGNLSIGDNNGGTATITSGRLSYTIETPNNLITCDDLQNRLFYDYDNVTTSVSNASCFILEFFGSNTTLEKANMVLNLGNTSTTQTIESVSYVYVDKDVTITGKGKTDNNGVHTSKTNNFSLALKEGWNAVYTKRVDSATHPAGNPSNPSSVTSTETITLNNPILKWILEIYE